MIVFEEKIVKENLHPDVALASHSSRSNRSLGELQLKHISVVAGQYRRQLQVDISALLRPLERFTLSQQKDLRAGLGIYRTDHDSRGLWFAEERGVQVSILAGEANADALVRFTDSSRPGPRAEDGITILFKPGPEGL